MMEEKTPCLWLTRGGRLPKATTQRSQHLDKELATLESALEGNGMNQERVWRKSGIVGRLEGEWWKWSGQRRKRVSRHLTLLWGS